MSYKWGSRRDFERGETFEKEFHEDAELNRVEPLIGVIKFQMIFDPHQILPNIFAENLLRAWIGKELLHNDSHRVHVIVFMLLELGWRKQGLDFERSVFLKEIVFQSGGY